MAIELKYRFYIPFGGEAAKTCERMIRETISQRLLNSLSDIHPDIRCDIGVNHIEDWTAEETT